MNRAERHTTKDEKDETGLDQDRRGIHRDTRKPQPHSGRDCINMSVRRNETQARMEYPARDSLCAVLQVRVLATLNFMRVQVFHLNLIQPGGASTSERAPGTAEPKMKRKS